MDGELTDDDLACPQGGSTTAPTPHAGGRSAAEIAAFFGREEMAALLATGARRRRFSRA